MGPERHEFATLSLAGRLDAVTARIERASDLVIVVISVALYVRILAQFVVQHASAGSGQAERVLGGSTTATL